MTDWVDWIADWRLWVALALPAALSLHISNFRPRKVKAMLREADAPSSTLLVFMHGLGDSRLLTSIFELARRSRPDADQLILQYDVMPFSNARMPKLAEGVEKQIADVAERYTSIVLVGFSVGALLTRRAFLMNRARFKEGGGDGRDWWRRVDRVVLVAGMNGGWSPRFVPFFGVMAAVARSLGVARIALQTERGCSFVEDLRLDFLAFAREAMASGGRTRPQILQLVGISDGVVDADSDMDLRVSPMTYFLTIDQTKHHSMIDVGRQTDPDDHLKRSGAAQTLRAQAIDFALRGDLDDPLASGAAPWIAERLSHPRPDRSVWEDPRVRRAVIVLHGIRDNGHWAERFRLQIESVLDEPGVVVISPSFGRFSMVAFMFPILGEREAPVRWFAGAYSEILSKYPNLSSVDFIGHSYGTFVFANALERYSAMKFGNAYLAGSVLPRDFPWSKHFASGKLTRVANATADNDIVVGIFPAFYQMFRKAPRGPEDREGGFFDVGDAGLRGFTEQHPNHIRIDHLKGGHGAFNESASYLDLASQFAVEGDSERFRAKLVALQENGSLAPRVRPLAATLNRFTPAVWLGILALLALVYSGLYVLTKAGVENMIANVGEILANPIALPVTGFVAFVSLFLYGMSKV